MSRAVGTIDTRMGALLREVRRAAGLTQKQLGAAMTISHQQIQKYETGANRISVGRLLEICQAIGIAPSDLISRLETAETASKHGGLRTKVVRKTVRST